MNPIAKQTKSMPPLLRALNSRNARLFFGGQLISVIGTWMQAVALSWLIYRLTNSVLMLGIVTFSAQLPMFLCAPFAGVLIDRWNKRNLLVITQFVSLLQAFALAALVFLNTITVWQIILLSIVLGLANAFDMPARQSFLIDIIEHKKDLTNAIALNSAVVNGARMIGPSIAGLLIFSFGEGWCFFINALSFLAVLVALLAMRMPHKTLEKANKHLLTELKDGLVYVYRLTPVRDILLLLALANLVATPYAVLMPDFAKDIFQGNSGTMGLLMASAGTGAMIGAIFLASKKSVQGFTRLIAIAAGVFSLGLILFAFSNYFWLSCATMLIVGFGMMVHMASSNSLLQSIVDDDKRGRVMSLFSMSFIGMAMFGNLLISSLAHFYGARIAVLIGALLFLLGTGVFSVNLPKLRMIALEKLKEKGLAPEITRGINAAAELAEPLESSF